MSKHPAAHDHPPFDPPSTSPSADAEPLYMPSDWTDHVQAIVRMTSRNDGCAPARRRSPPATHWRASNPISRSMPYPEVIESNDIEDVECDERDASPSLRCRSPE